VEAEAEEQLHRRVRHDVELVAEGAVAVGDRRGVVVVEDHVLALEAGLGERGGG